MKWRLLDTDTRTAAENMALDDALLECRSMNFTSNTIRLLRFDPPAVLVGYHQDVEQEVRLSYVREKRIDVNRRLTGGGAIYFDRSSIGWEVVASRSAVPSYEAKGDLFRMMCKGVIYALKTLGVDATFRSKNDIEVNGRKISGTGGVERGEAFLFQGTLLMDYDVETMIRSLRIPVVKLKDKELKSIRQRVTCLRWELGYIPSCESIKEALKEGFEKALEIKLTDGFLENVEKSVYAERLRYFQSDEWIYLDRHLSNESSVIQAVDKTPGGLMRVSIVLDKEAMIIKQILITGDFFALPSRAILDLEAALKCAAYRDVRSIVNRFFAERSVQILGLTPNDIVELILEAVDKLSYEELGVSGEEVNHLYPVLRRLKGLHNTDFEYLLLPYCAKHPSCKYRATEGCEKCGGCSVGDAYELAEQAGLKPVTVTNFERLMSVLRELKRSGSHGYIGCCCEAFYCKHRGDMEQVAVPGLIIDIQDQTCYDLGKEEEAYRGGFDAQTKLRIDLLKKLLPQLSRRVKAAQMAL